MPLILQYIIPGYISIVVFNFALSNKMDIKNTLITSCVVSYLLLSFVSLIRIRWFRWIPDTAIIISGLSVLIGVVVACLMAILSQRKWFRIVTVKLFHKTLNNDIWRDVFDLENGSNLKVYLKDKDYYIIGHLKNYEEKENDSWIALSSFAKFDKKINKPLENEPNYLDKNNIFITIRFSDIEHIEIF